MVDFAVVQQPRLSTSVVDLWEPVTFHGAVRNDDVVAGSVLYIATVGPFGIGGLPVTVPPGETHDFSFDYIPQFPGNFPTELRMVEWDPVPRQILGTLAEVQTALVVLVPPEVIEVMVAPSPVTVDLGGTADLSAQASFLDGTQRDVSAATTWTSLQPLVAQVSNGGMLQARAPGEAIILANFQGETGYATIEVTLPGGVRVPQGLAVLLAPLGYLLSGLSDLFPADVSPFEHSMGQGGS